MLRLILIVFLGLFVSSVAGAADRIELRISHFLPSSHPIYVDFLKPWAAELEKRTNGRVKATVYSAGSPFGNVNKQLDQVRAGIVDIAHGLTGVPRGRLPRSLVMDMPFLATSADQATRIMWALYPKYLRAEFKDLKILALHAHNPGLIHTRNKPVKTVDDIAGLRIRNPSMAVSMMLQSLGAYPVSLGPMQVKDALKKGVIDGTVFPYEAISGFGLAKSLKYHLDARAYTTSFFFAMNRNSYEKLPDDIRHVVNQMSGDNLIDKFGTWWDKWDKPGREEVQKNENTVTVLSDEERKAWRIRLKPMIEKYLSALESSGVSNIREIYKEAEKLAETYEK